MALWRVKLKNLANRVNLAVANRVARALKRADTIIAATSENQSMLQKRFGVKALLMQENAIPDEAISQRVVRGGEPDQPLRLIWIGSLDWRKSPDLLLDALAAVSTTLWKLDIIGTGPLRSMAEARLAKLGLADKVTLHGQIPRTKVGELLQSSDIHIVTSMGEGNPTTIWEAMAAGVPTLTLDHCGMHDVVCDACGVRIPLTDYAGTRNRLAAEIEALIVDRHKLSVLAQGIVTCREQFLWSRRSRQWLDIYHRAIQRWRA